MRLSVIVRFSFVSLGVIGLSAVSLPVLASPQDFPLCLDKLKQVAQSEGISTHIIDSSLATLKFVPKVIELDNQQPEFNTPFGDYFGKRVTPWRIEEGRKLYAQHRTLLAKLTQKYGVPGQYIMAFWGLETNFGSYKGSMPVLDSLATLACTPRRGGYFTGELMQALKLQQKYQLRGSDMLGSWAGAMGHTQFMPTTYASYAIDGDGDGKVDLWNSTADALTSAANFLHSLGWKANERWGREVRLPANYGFTHLGSREMLSISEWSKLDVRQANGIPLSLADMQAALYLPAGHTGPAFLGYHNFDVIMRWNRSEYYAISVGHLADRINGAEGLSRTPPEQPRQHREQIKLLQARLNELGFDVGEPDGVLGRNSMAGLQAFQRAQGLVADGFPGKQTFEALKLSQN